MLTGFLIALFLAEVTLLVLQSRRRNLRLRRAERRALTRVPGTPIAGVKDGEMVRIRGRVVARDELRRSPVSQRPCIGYRLIVESRDSISMGWQSVVEEEALDALVIADDTAQAVLHAPFDIKLAPHRETSLQIVTPALASLLAERGVPADEVFVTDRQFRYVEIVLAPGQEVAAFGRATVEIDSAGRAPSFRHPPTLCHLRGGEERVVLFVEADLAA